MQRNAAQVPPSRLLHEAVSASSASRVLPPKGSRRGMYAALVASVALAIVAAVQVLRPRGLLVPTTDWTQLTDFADSVTSPAFSHDGSMPPVPMRHDFVVAKPRSERPHHGITAIA